MSEAPWSAETVCRHLARATCGRDQASGSARFADEGYKSPSPRSLRLGACSHSSYSSHRSSPPRRRTTPPPNSRRSSSPTGSRRISLRPRPTASSSRSRSDSMRAGGSGSSAVRSIRNSRRARSRTTRSSILEDTDGDGRSDKTTVFADGLMIPTGLETLADGSGCYVGHGTELLLLKDHDGDGKADSREVVLARVRHWRQPPEHQLIRLGADRRTLVLPGAAFACARRDPVRRREARSGWHLAARSRGRSNSKGFTAARPSRKTHGDSSSPTGASRSNSPATTTASSIPCQAW